MSRKPQTPEEWLGEITDWQIVEANRITYGIGNLVVAGNVLIGPHEVGGQAFIPRGTWSNTPEGFGQPVTDKGWRHGVYQRLDSEDLGKLQQLEGYPVNGNESNLVWVDGTKKPLSLPVLGLKKADKLIEANAPGKLSDFAKEITVTKAKSLQVQLALEDEMDINQQKIRGISRELRQVTAEAASAFGSEWAKKHLNNYIARKARTG
jgi:hypothetical protein